MKDWMYLFSHLLWVRQTDIYRVVVVLVITEIKLRCIHFCLGASPKSVMVATNSMVVFALFLTCGSDDLMMWYILYIRKYMPTLNSATGTPSLTLIIMLNRLPKPLGEASFFKNQPLLGITARRCLTAFALARG